MKTRKVLVEMEVETDLPVKALMVPHCWWYSFLLPGDPNVVNIKARIMKNEKSKG